MRLAYPTWVEAGYAGPTDRVEVCCLSLLGRLAVDPMRLGCHMARAVGLLCCSMIKARLCYRPGGMSVLIHQRLSTVNGNLRHRGGHDGYVATLQHRSPAE